MKSRSAMTMAHAGAGEGVGDHGAQGAAADDHRLGLQKFPLSLLPDPREQDLARVAFHVRRNFSIHDWPPPPAGS